MTPKRKMGLARDSAPLRWSGHPDDSQGSVTSPHHRVATLTVRVPSASEAADGVPDQSMRIKAMPVTRFSQPRRALAAQFLAMEVIEFDPTLEEGRLDIDLKRWALHAGHRRKSDLPPPGKNSWKNGPNRGPTVLSYHINNGISQELVDAKKAEYMKLS